MEIYILRDGQQYGPYSEHTAEEHLRTGSLSPTDLAWHEGRNEWLPLSQLIASTIRNAAPPPPSSAPKDNSRINLFLAFSLGIVIAGGIAFVCFYEHPSADKSVASSDSATAFAGLYSCTEPDRDAARIVLKLDQKGFSFIELQNPTDDPNSAKEVPQDITVTYLHSGNGVVQMDGTIRQKITASFTTIGQPAKPADTTTTTSESEFTLQWFAGKDGAPDTVVLTMIDGRLQSLHFRRKT